MAFGYEHTSMTLFSTSVGCAVGGVGRVKGERPKISHFDGKNIPDNSRRSTG